MLSGAEVCAILTAHGFREVRRRGSHIVMQRRTAESTITVPVPDHKELRLGTLHSIVVMQAMSVLMRRIDAEGVVRGIQPPDTGPGCASIATNKGTINMNHGPGAILLAVSEVLKFR